jgi:vacuolar protein sorting-associated protein 13A/C
VDLASNVGGGVQDLFYEPMQGAVAGPKEFLKGVGRGSKGFVSGVVHGVSSSVAGVTGTVNKQLGMLALDDEYAAQREARLRSQADLSREGSGSVRQGFRDAGENVLGGLASGLGGFFSAPVKGAQKEGVGGFFKGVVRGVPGLVVKPVMGVSEGVTSLVTTVSDASDAKARQTERPAWQRLRRALPLRPATNRMVVCPYDQSAANAQAVAVRRGAATQGINGWPLVFHANVLSCF